MFSKNIENLIIKRNEDVVLKMIVTPDNEMCNNSIELIYEWKVAKGNNPNNYDIGN